PGNFTAAPASASQINLSWTASTDNIAVTNYLVERCQNAGCTSFVQIATPTATSFNDTGLASATTYLYRVRATDAGSNLSGYAGPVTAVTLGSQDTQAPAAPNNLVATASGTSQVNLSWTAATDNVGVTNYLIERCVTASCTFAQVATSTTTSISNTGLAAGTGYTYRVRATDAANNLGPYSGTAN